MGAMSPKSEHVSRELLSVTFRAYPRGLTNGFLFACLTVALVWPKLPHIFLAAWLIVFAGLFLVRLQLSRAFLAAEPPAAELDGWARRAAMGYGAAGIAWGVLGAAAILFAPEEPVYAVWIVFLISLFSVLQAQTTGSHPLVSGSFVFSAMAPVFVASVIMPAPNYWLRLGAEVLLFVMSLLVVRSGNRYVRTSIEMRYENVELLRDLTRQKEELDRANNAKTRFLAAASHDLRQPMQALVLLVESLSERVRDPEARHIVRNIRSSVTSMSALLNAILDISRFDAGTVKPQRSHFRVGNVLDRLRNTFVQPAAEKHLIFVVRPSSAIVETDHILLYRILANITSNALRYTDKGKVLIGCRRRRQGLEICVWDTGPGIPSDEIQEVFREFYQVDNAHRDHEQGLGLGLAIVERTARLLEHPVDVRSRVGHGSMFSVRVPYGAADQIQPERRMGDLSSLDGCRVLVVEDEKEVRAAMTLLLESWGCKVSSASTGDEVKAWMQGGADAPDIVIADYRLPGEANGLNVIRAVQEAHPSASGILVTGDIAPQVLKEAEESGFKLLHKPLRPARLRSVLGAAWRERKVAAAENRAGEAVSP